MRFDRICSVLIVELSRFYHAEGDSSGVNECNGDLSPVGVDVGERKFIAGLRIGRSPFYTRFAMRKLRFCFISCVLLAFSCGLQAQSGFPPSMIVLPAPETPPCFAASPVATTLVTG